MATVTAYSPEQLARWRRGMAQRDTARTAQLQLRRERALSLAEVAARLLREEFNAREIILFGSLADDDDLFTERSDIDLAAMGLESMAHLEAIARLEELGAEFRFDLLRLEHCPEPFRQSIERDGVAL